jgi:hypothetical protein
MLIQTRAYPEVICDTCLEPIGQDYRSERDFPVVLYRFVLPGAPPAQDDGRLYHAHAKCRTAFEQMHPAGSRRMWLYQDMLTWMGNLAAVLSYRPSDIAWAQRREAQDRAIEDAIEAAKVDEIEQSDTPISDAESEPF